jgi:hypothetical protein
MTKKIRWKRQPRETGLRAIGANAPGYDYHDGEIVYAKVSEHGWRKNRSDQWYWVAGWDSDVPYHNACNESLTLDEAKRQASEYVKSHLKRN